MYYFPLWIVVICILYVPNLLKAVSILIGFSISNLSSCPSSISIKRHLLLASKAVTPTQHIKKQRHYFANKGPSSQSHGFSSSHVWMWELYHKEGWALKNWCFWTVVLKKTLESPLDCKEIKPINRKENQHWIFIGRIDAETEAPVLWPPDAKSWLIRKDPGDGKDWRQEEKGTAENEMIRWRHRFNGYKFEQVLRVGEEQGSLVCYSPWGLRESDMTELLNNDKSFIYVFSLINSLPLSKQQQHMNGVCVYIVKSKFLCMDSVFSVSSHWSLLPCAIFCKSRPLVFLQTHHTLISSSSSALLLILQLYLPPP